MIYQIDDKYYINIAPNVYKEIKLRLEHNDVIIVPTENTREVYKMNEVRQIYFQHEKEQLKKKLERSNRSSISEESREPKSVCRKYRSDKRR